MAVKEISIRFGLEDGNCSEYIGTGWSVAERSLRWSHGGESVLALPPITGAASYLLTCNVTPFNPQGRERQELGIEINGLDVGRFRPSLGVPVAIIVPGKMLSAERKNVITLRNYDAHVPSQVISERSDDRHLGFVWRSFALAPSAHSEFARPCLLPELVGNDFTVGEIAMAFQSLGQNCEFGLFQRRCNVEPIGLLRWAYIVPPKLLSGLMSRFEGIDDTSALSLKTSKPGGHLTGHHTIYGLDYHTFLMESDVNVSQTTLKESERIGFLARMLIEQLEGNDKIFVRSKGFSTLRELRSLHLAMHVYNPAARLLYVDEAPPEARELIGRVEWLASGLYKGYVEHFAPEENAPDFCFDVWRRICETVFLFDRSLH